MSAASGKPDWQRRLSQLARGAGKPHSPLFAPLMYGVCSQIEALPPAQVTADPTRLAKCQGELRRVLGTEAFVVAAPSAMEAQALGAHVDRNVWPPRVNDSGSASLPHSLEDFSSAWEQSEALTASLEATRRIARSEQGKPVILAALTGPATLLGQLKGDAALAQEDFEFIGRALSALCREFAQGGASAILICEQALPVDMDAWHAALSTIANIARFHRVPALLAFETPQSLQWPDGWVACPEPASLAQQEKACGVCISTEPGSWADVCEADLSLARVMLSAADIDANADIDALIDACEPALERQQREDR
tara:strand:- start:5492 stop:6421 length:930 start_codon:yes stop_codon:yes gene_type:complete